MLKLSAKIRQFFELYKFFVNYHQIAPLLAIIDYF